MEPLLHEDFSGFSVGPLPCNMSATEEYHYDPPRGHMGVWHDPIRSYQWRPRSPWLVIEDEGRHVLVATVKETRWWPRILVTGDELWGDYELTLSKE